MTHNSPCPSDAHVGHQARQSMFGSNNGLSPSHCLSQCWLIIIWAPGNRNTMLVIHNEANLGPNGRFICPVWPLNLTDDLEVQKGASSMLHQALYIILWPLMNSNLRYSPETPNWGQHLNFLSRSPWNLTDVLKNNRAPLSCNINLRASIHGHWWIETYVTIRKRPTVFKICNFLSRVTLQFDGWHRKYQGTFSM